MRNRRHFPNCAFRSRTRKFAIVEKSRAVASGWRQSRRDDGVRVSTPDGLVAARGLETRKTCSLRERSE